MLPIGLILALDMAIADKEHSNILDDEAYTLMVLGMFREDMLVIPGTALTYPSPSVRHIWPWMCRYFVNLYNRSLKTMQAGKMREGQFILGRALHVLIDTSCPAHAKATWHCYHEPFERYVEAHAVELGKMSVPVLPNAVTRNAKSIISSILREARKEQSDKTLSPLGRKLKKWGWRKGMTAQLLEKQCKRLIPLVAAHVRAVLNNMERDIRLFK